jgi:ferredoxin--NADP+ reductase
LDAAPPASDPTPERLRKAKNLDILRGFANNKAGAKPVTVHFRFQAAPVAFRPGEVELTPNSVMGGKLAADLVVTCIGYGGEDFPRREDVFPVGWAKRGPTGTIPTNRAESHAVAQQVLAWLEERDPKSGPDVLPIAVDAAGWHRIDKHEIAAGAALGRPRVKLTDWQALLDVAQGG